VVQTICKGDPTDREEKGKNRQNQKYHGGGGCYNIETESISPTRVEEEKSVAEEMEVDQSAENQKTLTMGKTLIQKTLQEQRRWKNRVRGPIEEEVLVEDITGQQEIEG
jgi:hypothetical protein